MKFVKSILNREGTEISVGINERGDVAYWSKEDILQLMSDDSTYDFAKALNVKDVFNVHWHDRRCDINNFIVYYNTDSNKSPTYVYISDMDKKMRDLKIRKVIK